MLRINQFLGHFRKYKFSQEQIIKLCKESNGLLACKVSNFTGLFDYLKWNYNVKASQVVTILDDYPELALQNRRDLIHKKFTLIKENRTGLTDTYLRNLFKRHPDMFLLSYASMEAKVNYIKRNLNRNLHHEKAFPLLLHYNYREVIWPRGELLSAQGIRDYELGEVFGGSDEDFCKKFKVDPEVLKQKKESRTALEEKDRLWVYVAT